MPREPGRVVPPQAIGGRSAFEVTSGPWLGMRRSTLLGMHDPTFVAVATNMYSLDPVHGGAYVPVPQMGADTIVGAGGGTTFQLLGLYEQRNAPRGVAVIDGQIYRYDGSGTWNLAVTTANLGTAGITLSTTASCFGVTFANVYVINDGVNPPFTWDGGSPGVLTKLTNAPAKCFGQPIVYYSKLFFIKDVAGGGADRSTIVWSEEATPNTGYEAGGFSNVWTLEYSGHGQLYAICGTNEGLYFFRATSCGVIRGAVNATFVTAGTADAVSEGLGTLSPRGVMAHGHYVYAVTMDGHPYRIDVGGTPQPLWGDLSDDLAFPNALTPQIPFSTGSWAPAPYVNGVIFSANLGGADYTVLFDITTGRPQCLFQWSGSGTSGVGHDGAAQSAGVEMVSAFPDYFYGGGGGAIVRSAAAAAGVVGTAGKFDSFLMTKVLSYFEATPVTQPSLTVCFAGGDAEQLLQAEEVAVIWGVQPTLGNIGQQGILNLVIPRDENLKSGAGTDTIQLPVGNLTWPFYPTSDLNPQNLRFATALSVQARRIYIKIFAQVTTAPAASRGYHIGPVVLRGRLVPIGFKKQ